MRKYIIKIINKIIYEQREFKEIPITKVEIMTSHMFLYYKHLFEITYLLSCIV